MGYYKNGVNCVKMVIYKDGQLDLNIFFFKVDINL